MKKVLPVLAIAVIALSLSGCFLDSDSVSDIMDLSGPDEYAAAFQAYGALISPSAGNEAAALSRLDGIMESMVGFFEDGEWDASGSSWHYEEQIFDTLLVVDITVYNGNEFRCQWTETSNSVITVTGDAYYHPSSKSFKVMIITGSWEFWGEFATPDDGVSYFTQLAYATNLDAIFLAPGVVGPRYYAHKIYFLTDVTDLVGRINGDFFTDLTSFAAGVTSIYKNSPSTWDAWKTMWDPEYGEYTYDPLNGYVYTLPLPSAL